MVRPSLFYHKLPLLSMEIARPSLVAKRAVSVSVSVSPGLRSWWLRLRRYDRSGQAPIDLPADLFAARQLIRPSSPGMCRRLCSIYIVFIFHTWST